MPRRRIRKTEPSAPWHEEFMANGIDGGHAYGHTLGMGIPPLHLLVCSVRGCASDMTAMITTENGSEPHRLCQRHLDAAFDGIAIAVATDLIEDASRRRSIFFDELSPIEQWQLEGR